MKKERKKKTWKNNLKYLKQGALNNDKNNKWKPRGGF
jgi:hypothetical protein